jgi:sigma-B regulation protein RsbU (phosphoserine phosphatase)
MSQSAIFRGVPSFLRRQQSYVAIAVAIYAALWAAGNPVHLEPALVYTLFLCNVLFLMQDRLGFLYEARRPSYLWAIYMALLLLMATAGVVIVNFIEYPIHRAPGQTLWQFQRSGWKFPFTATLIVGVSTQLYRITKGRLERKNRELQRTVELEIAERKLQGQELQQAREIQQSLLPKEMPQIAGFEIDGAWEPARVVGGDYFDVIKLSDTKVGVCIADVVGKGVSAALLMANVQASVRAFASESVSPADLCGRVNSVLCANIASGKFVTLFYGMLDAERMCLQYTNAGHPRPILLGTQRQVEQLKGDGALLGVFPEWKYENSIQPLAPGDRLVLFTDGITEATMPEGEEFGEERLISVAIECAEKSTAEIKSQLLETVKKFCKSQLRDDATLIVISVSDARRDDEKAGSHLCAAV